MTDSKFSTSRHQCPDCDSSDGLAPTSSGAAYCHACPDDVAFKSKAKMALTPLSEPAKPSSDRAPYNPKDVLACKDYRPFIDRGLSVETARFFDVPTTPDGQVVFHYGKDAAKIRHKGKDFTCTSEFKQAGLFGMDKFPSGRRTLLVTEGEFDAMAAYQMQGSKWPTVSIKSGANSALKDCQANFEYMDSFETIVICFDADEPGIKAAAQVAELFGSKAKTMKHVKGHKDACDYLANNDTKAFIEAFWAAEVYTPDGIVLSSNLHDAVMEDLAMPFCRYPWDCLNLMFYGMRRGEIVTLTAGTGVGKTTVIKQLEEKIFEETNEKMGILSLEESTTTAALSLMSLSANKLFHLPTKKQMQEHILNDPANISKKPNLADTITLEEKEKAFTDILKNDRFVFVEHKGKQDVETVMSRIRYLAKAQDCGVVVLDHVSILVGLAQATGRSTTEAIDHVMHSLRSVVEETNILLLNICHLSKAGQGRESAEEGGRVKLGDMRGSQAIAQLSNIAIALEANRQHDDPEKRNLTYLRALKNRFSGETGLAGVLKYDSATGRLNEIEQEEVNMEDAL